MCCIVIQCFQQMKKKKMKCLYSPTSTVQIFGFHVFQLQYILTFLFYFSTLFNPFSLLKLSFPMFVCLKPCHALNVSYHFHSSVLFFFVGGEKHFSQGGSDFDTVGKICTMEMFYAALTNSHLKTQPAGYVYLPNCINIKVFCLIV